MMEYYILLLYLMCLVVMNLIMGDVEGMIKLFLGGVLIFVFIDFATFVSYAANVENLL